MDETPAKDLKRLILSSLVVFGLLGGGLLALDLKDGGIEQRTLRLLGSLALVPIVLMIAVAAPMLMWRWGGEASKYWGLGHIIVSMAIALLVLGVEWGRRPSTDSTPAFLMLAALGVGFMAMGWLMRRSEVWPKAPDEGERPAPILLATPPWLGPQVNLVYRTSDGLRTTYLVTRTADGARVRLRDEEDLQRKAKLAQMLLESRQKFPKEWEKSDEDDLREATTEWEEFDLSDDYGNFLIDWSVEAKRPERGDSRILGPERVRVAGGKYRATAIEGEGEHECHCVFMAPFGMIWIGPGRCWRCRGVLSRLRRCEECGGTGKCDRCTGDGKVRWKVRNWFEVNTGLLLRREQWSNGTPKPVVELESLDPNVLEPFAVP